METNLPNSAPSEVNSKAIRGFNSIAYAYRNPIHMQTYEDGNILVALFGKDIPNQECIIPLVSGRSGVDGFHVEEILEKRKMKGVFLYGDIPDVYLLKGRTLTALELAAYKPE